MCWISLTAWSKELSSPAWLPSGLKGQARDDFCEGVQRLEEIVTKLSALFSSTHCLIYRAGINVFSPFAGGFADLSPPSACYTDTQGSWGVWVHGSSGWYWETVSTTGIFLTWGKLHSFLHPIFPLLNSSSYLPSILQQCTKILELPFNPCETEVILIRVKYGIYMA